MVKEFLQALLAFVVTAIVIIILMTAAGNALFPSAVHIVETRLKAAADTPSSGGMRDWSAAGPPTIPHPGSPPAPGISSGPGESSSRPAAPLAGDVASGGAPAPADDAPAPPPEETETTGSMSESTIGAITDDHDLSQGDILPLGDGRVAYKVESGDTFSQICKKVIGTGRQQVWQEAARMMEIDIRALRPGMVLIFDESVLALGQEEEE